MAGHIVMFPRRKVAPNYYAQTFVRLHTGFTEKLAIIVMKKKYIGIFMRKKVKWNIISNSFRNNNFIQQTGHEKTVKFRTIFIC